MINKSPRMRMRRKHRRLMAAVAGAAVMSSTLLPGIPAAKVYASADPNVGTPITTSQSVATTTPAVATTTPAVATTTPAVATTTQVGDPVQVVRDNAGTYGFDSTANFSLLSQSNTKAIVRVRAHGQTFKVDLTRSGDSWNITTIRGIGDMTHPATYTPASMYPSQWVTTLPAGTIVGQSVITVPATLGISQQILYQTNKFDNWAWHLSTYPQNMSVGLFLQNPILTRVASVLPANVLTQINNTIDFGRQLVLYAHLGTVGPHGYGIGIAQVAQTGNNITVTVRTKSPLPNEPLAASKTDDFIAVDRASLDFSNPIIITFVDQNGTVLNTYTITTR